jgi:hypothetical protein
MNPNPRAQMLHPSMPWWRVPVAWLAFGGPASVVLACIVTAFFVLRGSDRVVRDYEPEAEAAIASAKVTSGSPAEHARNHVAATMH